MSGNWNQVTARLFTGGALENGQADVDELIASGVTHIIDAAYELESIDSALFATQPTLSYLPNGTLDDGSVKGPEWFSKSIDFALSALRQPHNKVYMHCRAGVNRGPSTCYAVMRALSFPPEEAEKLIRKARPIVGLRYKDDADTAIKVLGYE